MEAFELAISFMPKNAAMVASSRRGAQIQAAFASHIVEPSSCGTPCTPRKVNIGRKMTSGATSCITLTPRLPSPPLMPSALPCLDFGKKKLMLPMLDAKLAPANPQSRAMMIKIQYGVAGF